MNKNKPRLKLFKGMWYCTDYYMSKVGSGETFHLAYMDWEFQKYRYFSNFPA